MVKTYCTHCLKKCVGDVLKVGEKYFHLDCFKCKDCNLNLDTGGFYFRDGDYYCPTDYTQRFSNKCFICSKIIESEIVSALNNHFHRNCFKCSICYNVFSPGDRVTMKCDKFICNTCLTNKTSDCDDVKMRELSGRKPCDVPLNNDKLHEDIITDQGYISSDPTSFSYPVPKDGDNTPTVDTLTQLDQRTKSKSCSSRSLFEFGKFYRSSYLDIQESREKERQSQSRTSSRNQTHKFSSNFHLPVPKNRYLKTPNKDVSSSPRTGIRGTINSPILKLASTSEVNVKEQENAIRLSSYPAGEKPSDSNPVALERDDWPAPLSTTVLFNEKMLRQKNLIEKPTPMKTNNIPGNEIVNYTQSLNHLVCESSEKQQNNLKEILRGTTNHHTNRKLDANVISSSRSPNASIEPLSKPRYSNHKDKSKSRDSSYFNDSQRHMGYSLEFISSTSRSFMAGRVPYGSKPVTQRDILHDLKSESGRESRTINTNNCDNGDNGINFAWSTDRTMSDTSDLQQKNNEYDSTLAETLFDYQDGLSSSEVDLVTGLKITKKRSYKDRINEPNTKSNKSSIDSKTVSLETLSCQSQRAFPGVKNFIVSHHDIVSRDTKIMKGLDITRLEIYLSTEEFQQIFKLNHSDFYRLPEWKRNDLKRRVHLF